MNRPAPISPGEPIAVPIRQCIRAAIEILEDCYHGGKDHKRTAEVRNDLVTLCRSGEELAFSILLELVRERTVPAGWDTVWFARRYSPYTAAFVLLSEQARVPWERGITGQIFERDFPRLTLAAGRLAGSPLMLFDGRKSARTALGTCCARQALRLGICDSPVPVPELAALRSLSASRDLVLVFPRT